jgi:DNA-binding HxlR family transcriptional regulator
MKKLIYYNTSSCPAGYAFAAIEGKWKLPCMYVLCENGTLRYNELKKALGITNMMLSNTLKDLESYGLVVRIQYNEIPPRVEYSLTEIGSKLLPVMNEFSAWGALLMEENKNRPDAPDQSDANQKNKK